MSIAVHTLKHMPDLYRREPRNVGLVVVREEEGQVQLAFRFKGWDEAKGKDHRSVPKSVDSEIYFGWIDYYLRKVRSKRWSDIQRLKESRPVNFYLEQAMLIPDGEPLHLIVERMYRELVEAPSEKTKSDKFKSKVSEVFSRAKIEPEVDQRFQGIFWGVPTLVKFPYSYHSGGLHLMDRIPLYGKKAEVEKNAHDLLYRMQAVHESQPSSSFIAFTDLSDKSDDGDSEDFLNIVERMGNVVDLSDVGRAAGEVRELVFT
ncbi:hypothetical protein [Nocardiopsis dassonvillei]|uniref:hypothetical protein n=1 Tax=Nocardiopsis dassonvillei TaxID=2014 RepID=UPI00366B36D6